MNYQMIAASLLMIATLSACSPKNQAPENAVTKEAFASMTVAGEYQTDEAVSLKSRYTIGDYVSASYSFRHMTQDVNITRNNWDVLFEGRADFEDFFQTQTVVDDFSFIFDLGEKSCKDIKSSYPQDRVTRPLVWLAYSDAAPGNQTSTRSALVKVNHCYLVYGNDEDGRIVALFHVADHVKSESVKINEIEVLEKIIK